MKKEEIIENLLYIKEIINMSDEELLKKYSFLTKEKLNSRSRNIIVNGIVEGEIDILIKEIERGWVVWMQILK